MMKKLTPTDIHDIVLKAKNGFSHSQIAQDFGVARQTIEYQLEKNGFYSTPKGLQYRPGRTLAFTGTFWLYYNTQRGRPPAHVTELPRPWILRRILDLSKTTIGDDDASESKLMPDSEEILCNEVRLVQGHAETKYYRNPIWINKRGDHIRYVRGFLILEGMVEVKT